MEFWKKREYYTTKEIRKYNALYNMVWGGRNAGKSTQILWECVEDSYEENRFFGLIFRFEKRNKDIEKYLNSNELMKRYYKMTDGEYSKLEVKSGEIYFIKIDEDTNKKIKGKTVGYVFYIEHQEFYKSLSFDNVYNLIFEEFVTRERYLIDEPTEFESLVSTIFRNRIFDNSIKIWLIGNLVSRVNPYISAWNLSTTVNQKEDSIMVFEIRRKADTGEEMVFKIACQRCKDYQKAGIALGVKAQQQETAQWETDKVSVLENWKSFECKYEFVFTYSGFYFLCRFLKKGSQNLLIYVERKTTPIKENTRVIGDIESTSILYTSDFIPLVEKEKIIFNLISSNKIFFCDALTGTDFYTCYRTMKKSKTV